MARPGSIERLDAHALEPDGRSVLGRFQGVVTAEQCHAAMQLLQPQPNSAWRARSGFDAILAALDTRPVWRLLTWLPRLPGLRSLFAAIYRSIARRRLAISARLGLRTACTDACAPTRP